MVTNNYFNYVGAIQSPQLSPFIDFSGVQWNRNMYTASSTSNRKLRAYCHNNMNRDNNCKIQTRTAVNCFNWGQGCRAGAVACDCGRRLYPVLIDRIHLLRSANRCPCGVSRWRHCGTRYVDFRPDKFSTSLALGNVSSCETSEVAGRERRRRAITEN